MIHARYLHCHWYRINFAENWVLVITCRNYVHWKSYPLSIARYIYVEEIENFISLMIYLKKFYFIGKKDNIDSNLFFLDQWTDIRKRTFVHFVCTFNSEEFIILLTLSVTEIGLAIVADTQKIVYLWIFLCHSTGGPLVLDWCQIWYIDRAHNTVLLYSILILKKFPDQSLDTKSI